MYDIYSANTKNVWRNPIVLLLYPPITKKENIENIIRAVFGLEKFFHILIIEDNSPDGTATIVRKLQTEFPDRLFMVERKGKLGLGTAYIAGFKWAIEHQYDFVFEMDADFSHNPNDLPRCITNVPLKAMM